MCLFCAAAGWAEPYGEDDTETANVEVRSDSDTMR